jgi:hypothetical protein
MKMPKQSVGSLTVEDVTRPQSVLAIEVAGLGRRTLPGTASLHLTGGVPHLSPRFDDGAALHLWWNGDGWRAREGGRTRDVAEGDSLRVGAVEVRSAE